MTSYAIGELARRTGLTVKAVRFYSDEGLVPPVDRSPAGYRRYDADALARLDLIRTLRELGLDLATIRRVLEHETSLADVVTAHADALAVQIRTLRQRHAVLTAVAARGATPEEIDLVHRLARLTEHERHRLVDDFRRDVFGDPPADPAFVGIAGTLTPHLPDDPTPEQVDAWVELARLITDDDFRALMREIADQHTADHEPGTPPRPGPVAMVVAAVGPNIPVDVDPRTIVTTVTARYAASLASPDDDAPTDTALRHRLVSRLRAAADPRRERYEQCLAVLNGWPPPDPLGPALTWFLDALEPSGLDTMTTG